MVVLGALSIIYFYSHYFFASMTAHISSMYGVFLVLCISMGAPPLLAAMMFAVLSPLSAGITHYGTGTAPVYFGTGYVSTSDWWRIGAIISVINLAIWLIAGSIWWKIIGLW